ncbi:MAG: ArnT family glycosyltransferase [Microgenomates group bacterium]
MKKEIRTKITRLFFYLLFFLGLYLFLTYKLTEVPPGINLDEASIGYNAALISETLRDENKDLLPVFVLTLDGRDWKQPVTIYLTSFIFKIFGKSYFNLRLVSVLLAIVSGFIFLKFLRLFFSEALSVLGMIIFFSSPSVLIQSHLALENIAILPFFLLWLFFLASFFKKPQIYKVFLAGIFLGIDIYAYKGSRALVPIFLVASWFSLIGYSLLYYKNLEDFKFKRKIYTIIWPVFCFSLGILPFILPLKKLNTLYGGAVYDPGIVSFKFSSLYEPLLIYLSSFDASFLFIKGDSTLIHSTGRHGMFLFPFFFLFFLGLFQMARKKRKFYYFILVLLGCTPLLFTSINSIYRASRLMVYIPLFSFIFTLGVESLFEIKNKFLKLMVLGLAVLIFAFFEKDFLNFYFNSYSKLVTQEFSPNFDLSFKKLTALVSGRTNFSLYVEKGLFNHYKSEILFYKQIYFPNKEMKIWERDKEKIPDKSVILTDISGSNELYNIEEIPGFHLGQKTLYLVGEK